VKVLAGTEIIYYVIILDFSLTLYIYTHKHDKKEYIKETINSKEMFKNHTNANVSWGTFK
jgi:hypothetical protein